MEEYIFFIAKIFTLQEVTIIIQCSTNENPKYFHAPPNYSRDSVHAKSVIKSQAMKDGSGCNVKQSLQAA
jgi:hypothetical protein